MKQNLLQDIQNLKNLPALWKVIPFTKLVKDVSGGNKKLPKSSFLENGSIAVVDQGKELIAGFHDNAELIAKADPPVIIFGDHTRALKYIDFPFIMGADGTKILKINEEFDAEVKYLYYFFLTLNVPDTGYNRHFKYLKQAHIPLPPLEEQKKIAAILDAADVLRQKDKALIAKYEELTQSLFLHMFGDPVTNPKGWEFEVLEELAEIASGVTKGRKLKKEKLIDIPYMRVANVQDGYLDLNEVKTIPGTEIDFTKYKLKSGDVLLTEGGDPDKLGRGAVWNDEIPNCIHQNHIFRVRVVNNRIHPLYLSKLTGSAYGKNYFLKSSKQTTGIASINKTQLRNFPVFLPPINLQNQFAERVEEVAQQKKLAQQSLQKSEELFNSLLQRAFKGELTQEGAAQLKESSTHP